jgi:uncharacterized membrane protein
MSDIIDVNPVDSEKAQSLKTVGWVSYILHLIVAVAAVLPGAQASPVLLIVALVIHFSWRIRTVIWAAVLYLVTLPLWLLFVAPGWIAWCLISIWFLYRIVKGMVRMNASQAMPD